MRCVALKAVLFARDAKLSVTRYRLCCSQMSSDGNDGFSPLVLSPPFGVVSE